MNEQISVDCRTFQTLAIQSLRYCMGRTTYAVSDCDTFIRKHWEHFDNATKETILRDLTEQLKRHENDVASGFYAKYGVGTLGNQCDYRIWEALLAWMQQQDKQA